MRHCVYELSSLAAWAHGRARESMSWLADSSRCGAGEMLTANGGKNWNRGKPIGWVTGEPGKSIQAGSRENRSNRGAGEIAATGEMAHAPVKRRGGPRSRGS